MPRTRRGGRACRTSSRQLSRGDCRETGGIYHFTGLSGWNMTTLGGESVHGPGQRLAERALVLGDTTLEHRTDSLSAAFANPRRRATICASATTPCAGTTGWTAATVAGPRRSKPSRPSQDPLPSPSAASIDGLLRASSNRRFAARWWRATTPITAMRCTARPTIFNRCPGGSCDYDEATVVTSASGFVLRKVFYTGPPP